MSIWFVAGSAAGLVAAVFGLLGSIVGTLLVFYMVFQGAYGLLTPLLLEVFLLLWTLPVLILSKN